MSGFFSPAEVVDLLLVLAIGPAAVLATRRAGMPRRAMPLIGFGAMAAAYVFTIAEGPADAGLRFHDLFNMFEHLCYAVAGVAFAIGVWQVAKAPESAWWEPR